VALLVVVFRIDVELFEEILLCISVFEAFMLELEFGCNDKYVAGALPSEEEAKMLDPDVICEGVI
jgi:hypothetical protein